MPEFPREELEEMVARWLEANKKAEQEGNWAKHLGPFYTDDAEYRWNMGPNEEFVARGRRQIEEWALGVQMQGFEDWSYPYDRMLKIAFNCSMAKALPVHLCRPPPKAIQLKGVLSSCRSGV